MTGSDYQRVAKAIRFIQANLEGQPRLADVAGHLGLSEFHFHRLFHKWAGITPKDFLQMLTLARAKRLLADSRDLLDASLTLGLSGSSRLHDLFVTLEAMTPGEFKAGAAGVTVRWGIHPTPFGHALLAASSRGLCGLAFLERAKAGEALQDLRLRWPEAQLTENPRALGPMAREIASRMRGQAGSPLHLVLKGSSFQVKVWEALLAIPEGQLATYQKIARSLGCPGASRAVGNAVASNPIAYLIPCHRVIKATGVVGNYRWGTERKTIMIAAEGARRRVGGC
jgi:AraC family transcriptional regulator, regulatory protein of adaptative response / methylated-DNA-[protein]-cysteine methyltransferase